MRHAAQKHCPSDTLDCATRYHGCELLPPPMLTPPSAAPSTLLIVDDAPENLYVLSELLSPHYRVLAANGGEQALRVARSALPDLILLDVMMPGVDGYEVMRQLQADTATHDIPVIFLTALSSARDEELGLGLGAVDYISKPITPAVVLARVRAHLLAKRARDWLRDQNLALEAEVARRMAENELIQQVSIRALAHLAEIRDPETGRHLSRTQAYVQRLGQRLQSLPRFANQLDAAQLALIVRSAPLHDIGKVGVPDHILNKPGTFTPDEWRIMQTHAKMGSDAIEQAERDIARPVAFLHLARDIAHWHHEKWDGSGYPDGLAGDAIPLAARLMAVADVFDALISPRVYKPAFDFDHARELIAQGRGSHFDPDIVDAFLRDYPDFVAIAQRHAEPQHAPV
ncbi:MAG: two-component system response regulator [Rhodoferax sp.]